MKPFFTLSLHLLIASFLCAQAPQGIPYQAVIRDNVGAPLVNASVTVRFTLHQNTIDGPVEYQETQSLSTNAFGVVNTQFGIGMATQGSFENIVWSNTTKFIQVEANNGSGYLDMGTQQMMSVPFAMYSSKSANATYADNGFSNVSPTGDTLYMSNGMFIIVPGISAANFPPAVLGCTNAQACNYSAAATQDNGSCLIQGATCDDGNANTTNDVINANCQCAGTATGNGVFVPGNGVTDIDGTVYTSIVINGQEWMQQNLAVSKYRNGDPIPTGLDDATWQNTTNGAYAIYNNDAANNTTYGKLYNWYTTVDTRGLCPTGWHMPSDADWTTLINYLDPSQNPSVFGTQSSVAGGKMKSTIVWNSPNTGATNESGFTGLPGGYRLSNGTDYYIGNYGTWWSSTENDSGNAWNRKLYYLDSSVRRDNNYKQDGFSVRCVKDTTVPVLQGCTDGSACNFMANATQDDGSCLYQNATCDDGNANTMNDVIGGNCVCTGVLMVSGCTSAQACNYNPSANVDDGSCLYQNATCDDGDVNTVNDVINSECVCAGSILPPPLYTIGNGVTDIDGNFYPSILINGQEWMQQNLAVTKYRNGDPIPTGLDDATWHSTTSGAYAIYNNDVAHNATYGKLYNWYAVNDNRGLCPTGWHVPSDAEWTTLATSLGGSSVAGGKMKSTTGWTSPNTGATNESGFTGLPGGYRNHDGAYYDNIGYDGIWWSSTEYYSSAAWARRLGHVDSDVVRGGNGKHYGISVRCVRD